MKDLRALAFRLSLPGACVLAATLVYGYAFVHPTFNPEHAFHYMLNAGMTWRDWIGHYLTTGDLFYRPSAYYTWYQVVTRIVDWHDIQGFRLVTLGLLLVLTLVLARVGRVLLDDDRLACGLAALFFLVHPLTFIPVYEISGFDLLYQFAVLGILGLVGGGALHGPRRRLAVVGCLLLYAAGLTAKEQTIAVPLFLGLLLTFDPKARASAEWRVLLAGVAALTAIYLRFDLPRMGYVATGDYRTGFNLDQLLGNLTSGPLWIVHLFVVDSDSWPWMKAFHEGPANTLYGVVIVAISAWYGVRVGFGADRGERHRLLVLAAFVVATLALPIYSGGRPWHYALPLAGFALILGRATAAAIRTLPDRRVAAAASLGAAAIPVLLSMSGLPREIEGRLPMFRVCYEALEHPPVPPGALPPGATVLYATGPNSWVYGLGRLFRFVYRDPTLTEIFVSDINALTPKQALAWRSAAHAAYFVYDPERLPAWRDQSAELRARLSSGWP